MSEAHLVGKALRHVVWDIAYSSDLPRASRTCRILLEQSLGDGDSASRVAIETPLVREVHYGVREMLPCLTTTAEARVLVAARLGIDEKDVVDTAETPEHIRERQSEFLQKLRDDFSGTTHVVKVLCVSHGGFIKRFLDGFCGHTIKKIHNCSISMVCVSWSDDLPEILCTTEETAVDFVDHVSAADIVYPFV